MTAAPKRREVRRAHLDAATVPVERALLERAKVLTEQADALNGDNNAAAYQLIADQFAALAEELHWVP